MNNYYRQTIFITTLPWMYYLLLVGIIIIPPPHFVISERQTTVKIINRSRHNIELYRINSSKTDDQLVRITTKPPHIIKPGTTFHLNTFVNHTFFARELCNDGSHENVVGECPNANITVDESKRAFYLHDDMDIDRVDRRIRTIQFVNESGRRVNVYWVNGKTGQWNLVNRNLETGSFVTKESFVNHTFGIRDTICDTHDDYDDFGNRSSNGKACRTSNVTVDDKEKQIFFIRDDLTLYRVYDKLFQGYKTTTTPSSSPTKTLKRRFLIHNRSGHAVELDWINLRTGQTAPASNKGPISDGEFRLIASSVNHTFMIRQLLTDVDTTTFEIPIVVNITVNEKDDQVFTLHKNRTVDHTSKSEQQTNELTSACQQKARQAFQNHVNVSADMASRTMDELVSCISSNVRKTLDEHKRQMKSEQTVREDMANSLEDYVCADYEVNTTAPKEIRYWTTRSGTFDDEKVTRQVNVLHERKSSNIHLVKHFITPEECKAVEWTAANRFGYSSATVSSPTGAVLKDEERKAKQSHVKIPWEEEMEGHPLAALSRRIFDYANHVMTNLEINAMGHDPMMSIVYTGRGTFDKTPDRYSPHCDGDCYGNLHEEGDRIATMVMYCTVPETGGTTHFKNAGVRIVPTQGAAVFFSYMGLDDKVHDDGFTFHSGCPVIHGVKTIVTQWIRYWEHPPYRDHCKAVTPDFHSVMQGTENAV